MCHMKTLVILVVFINVGSSNLQCNGDDYFNMVKSNRSTFMTLTSEGLFSCALACCNVDGQCVGFFYDDENQTCELLQNSIDEYSSHYVWIHGLCEDCVYYIPTGRDLCAILATDLTQRGLPACINCKPDSADTFTVICDTCEDSTPANITGVDWNVGTPGLILSGILTEWIYKKHILNYTSRLNGSDCQEERYQFEFVGAVVQPKEVDRIPEQAGKKAGCKADFHPDCCELSVFLKTVELSMFDDKCLTANLLSPQKAVYCLNIAAGCGTDVFCQASYTLQQEVAVSITIPEADDVPIYKDYLRAFGYNVNNTVGNSLIILADLKIPNGCMCGPL